MPVEVKHRTKGHESNSAAGHIQMQWSTFVRADSAMRVRSIFEPLSVCGAEYATENNTARSRAFFKEYQNDTALPWTSWRGPELWETRLQDYWRLRGVSVTKAYLKVCIPHGRMPLW